MKKQVLHDEGIYLRDRRKFRTREAYLLSEFHVMIKTVREACAQCLCIEIEGLESEILECFHAMSLYICPKKSMKDENCGGNKDFVEFRPIMSTVYAVLLIYRIC
jgi:hypothetical protein